MSEILSPIDKDHEEALVINEEVDERRKKPENWFKSNSALAEFIITQREEEVNEIFASNPVEAQIRRTYKREETGSCPVYLDPTLDDSAKKIAQEEVIDILQKKGPEYLKKLGEMLPDTYLEPGATPFFVHSQKTIDQLFGEDYLGAGFSQWTRNPNVHLIPKIEYEGFYQRIFIHELVHSVEPESKSPFGKQNIRAGGMNEGVARMTELRFFGISPHDELLECLEARKDESRHPLSNAIASDGKIRISPLELSVIDFSSINHIDKAVAESNIATIYTMHASFIDWYKNEYFSKHNWYKEASNPLEELTDPEFDNFPNYQEFLRKMQEYYTINKVTDAEGQEHPFSSAGDLLPKEIEVLTNTNLYRMVMQDSDQYLADFTEKIEKLDVHSIKDRGEFKSLVFDLYREVKRRFGPIEDEYSQFLTEVSKKNSEW